MQPNTTKFRITGCLAGFSGNAIIPSMQVVRHFPDQQGYGIGWIGVGLPRNAARAVFRVDSVLLPGYARTLPN